MTDGHRPKHERRTARALHAQLATQGYGGGYTWLTDFIRQWREQQGKLSATSAFLPLAFELGHAFQFDWSDEGLVVGGIYYRVQLAPRTCRNSRISSRQALVAVSQNEAGLDRDAPNSGRKPSRSRPVQPQSPGHRACPPVQRQGAAVPLLR